MNRLGPKMPPAFPDPQQVAVVAEAQEGTVGAHQAAGADGVVEQVRAAGLGGETADEQHARDHDQNDFEIELHRQTLHARVSAERDARSANTTGRRAQGKFEQSTAAA